SRAKKERAPGGALNEPSCCGVRLGKSGAVRGLAVRGDVQALALLILADAQADRHVDQLVRNQRDDSRPQDGDADRLRLRQDLRTDALEAGAPLAPVSARARGAA